MQPFLNCHIFSVHNLTPVVDFYFIQRVYFYNSLESGIVYFDEHTTQIPQFEIDNLNLLNQLKETDINTIHENGIPILRRLDDKWMIDFTHYENFKLQSSNIQNN